jgi:hypothetical protein
LDKTKKNIDTSRKIIEDNGYRLLTVFTIEDMKIISSPRRQRIFKLLQTAGRPLHSKEIADYEGIKAPSAHFHLCKLEAVDAVKVSYTKVINGITATYYEPNVDGILAGGDFLSASDTKQAAANLLLAANYFDEAKRSFLTSLEKKMQGSTVFYDSLNELYNEILYLSLDDATKLQSEMENLFKKYTAYSSNKQPFTVFISISEAGKIIQADDLA